MYLQLGWGDGDQAGGAGSVSEAGSGWHGSGVCWVTIQGWAGGWAGLGLGSGLGWVLLSILIHHSQLPNKPYLSRPPPPPHFLGGQELAQTLNLKA